MSPRSDSRSFATALPLLLALALALLALACSQSHTPVPYDPTIREWEPRITSYNVCYTKLLRWFGATSSAGVLLLLILMTASRGAVLGVLAMAGPQALYLVRRKPRALLGVGASYNFV